MDPYSFAIAFTFWHIVYYLISFLLRRLLAHPAAHARLPSKSARHRLLRQAPAYVLSTIHALLVTTRGIQHFRVLLHAPVHIQLQHPPPALAVTLPPEALPYVRQTAGVLFTNVMLGSYLCADLVHILKNYPDLGGLDTVLHHLAFFLCATVAGAYHLCPFMFSWLIIGEVSTPFLNLRWFLIRVGKGDRWYFRPVQTIFALLFVITRFFIYAAGLAYQLTIVSQVPDDVPTWAVFATMSFVVTGFVLNLTWLKKIWRLAKGETRARTHTEESHAKAE